MPMVTAATSLRQALADPEAFVVAPGVYDGFSARIALGAGFNALYMTGAGTAASVHGHADLGICTLNDMRANAEMISNLSPTTPVIADADTGYGGPIMVGRTTEQYSRSGVAAFHIEDQVQTKRCGHLGGKILVDQDTYVTRIRAAVQARQRIGSDIVVIARTDALQVRGYEESVARLRAARDAGADVGFLEGITSKEMARQVVQDLAGWPLLLNMVEHGATPDITAQEAKEMGFRIIIFPFAAIGPAYKAMQEAMEKLKRDGIPGLSKEMTPQMLFRVCGLDESMKVDAEAGGAAFEGGVELQK
ncbi:Phosphoenolpyruvate/pyruvate domain-containing protein [Aspergillus uvarum CBS 121591]|uniref:Phosphoenolpyruvate/pyruvate domain-containing protein n=1 Tax=Aspergillus uvarum CBS 121591 TaxID=1448315 RepID=A0A319C654_9EURO|nr:Phosphoenolpyruvate/pyruvate domain-containing protein [Aspergillus uvarum CBS 121591]PYH80664.1 Phosphoenolpyruvate/pyruvate domain-containing protein [Aspergillus uvarum CBS 121591]